MTDTRGSRGNEAGHPELWPAQSPPALRTVTAYVDRYAAERPETVALSGATGTWTYAELARDVDRYAGALRAHGIEPGAIVSVLSNSRPEALVAFLACCRIGAAYLGLNPKYTARELAYVLGDAAPRVAFVLWDGQPDEFVDPLREALESVEAPPRVIADRAIEGVETIALESFIDDSPAPQPDAPTADPDAVAAIVYTSGSTGAPKGALLSQTGMVRQALLGWRYWYGALPAPRTVAQHPINHVGWLVCECVSSLVAGGTAFFRERFDGGATLKLIERERIDLWPAFPAMVMLAMQSPEYADADLGSLRRIALGSAPSVDLLRSFHERWPDVVFSVSYGLTEANGCAVTATTEHADHRSIAATVGHVVPGIDVRLLAREAAPAAGADGADGDIGEILIRDPSLFLGYLNRPDATAESLRDGWLHTGDLARVRADGQLQLVGRMKEMFKSGGYNVYPTEVEAVIGADPTVREVAVVQAPDPMWGEVGVAFVVTAAAAEFDESALRASARAELANYKVPKRFEPLAELPRLRNGKVDRVGLREQARTLTAAAT